MRKVRVCVHLTIPSSTIGEKAEFEVISIYYLAIRVHERMKTSLFDSLGVHFHYLLLYDVGNFNLKII
jgi:hypothetical protein